MVHNDNNPSDGKKQAIQPEKKVVVYSPRGKSFLKIISDADTTSLLWSYIYSNFWFVIRHS